MIFDIGPFRLHRVEKDDTLCVWLIRFDDCAFGWEYGWHDPQRDAAKPLIEFRIGKLLIAYLEVWNGGCEIWFLGFWAFPSWGKGG